MSAGYRALTEDVGLVELTRDVLRVEGGDASAFLQGQVSQDLDALPQPYGFTVSCLPSSRSSPRTSMPSSLARWGAASAARL